MQRGRKKLNCKSLSVPESHFIQNYLHRATTKPFISKTASSVYLLLLASNYSRSNNKVVDGGEMLRLRELYALDI